MPHAPLLTPYVPRSRAEPALDRVRAAVHEAARGFERTTVIVSPHGTSTGVYVHPSADLDAFGLTRASARVDVDERAARTLAEAWGRPLLDGPPDHGVVVPVMLGPVAGPAVCVAFAEGTDPTDDASSLADAIATGDLDVIASVNTGAGITERAPLTKLDEAVALEAELAAALEAGARSIADVAARLASEGGSCSLGPLLVFARLFAGVPARVLAHEWPFGVGYLVAVAERKS